MKLARKFYIAILLLSVASGLWIWHVAFLIGLAELWVVSDQVSPADVAVVLGGNLEARPVAAAELYRLGTVKKVAISQVFVPENSLIPSHTELNKTILLKLGVPPSAIVIFGKANKNTFEEAIALEEWMRNESLSSAIVPMDIFSTRRVGWTLRGVFARRPVQIQVLALRSTMINERNWWKSEQGLIAFQNEVLKHVYYKIIY